MCLSSHLGESFELSLSFFDLLACSANALVIHYTSNDNLIQNGDLVLVDAGCELK